MRYFDTIDNGMLDVKHYRNYHTVRNWALYRCVKTKHNRENMEDRSELIENVGKHVDFTFTICDKYFYCKDPQDLLMAKLWF